MAGLHLLQRQVSSTLSAAVAMTTERCEPFALPAGGTLLINPTSTLVLTSKLLFTPPCAATPTTAFPALASGSVSGITDVKDPFYASVTPQVYATAASTVIAWMLVIMLLITPRTYFVGGAGGGFGILNRHGMIGGSQGSASLIGVGSRPWLQKVAALTVAISLTIATADTFRVAADQYSSGYMNAEGLRSKVVNSTEIKVTRVVSDIFVWLAQVQTLIRLFPRHKEKVLIKWIGFALIILDATFSALNSFLGNPIGRPKRFRDAIPALSYLFQLSLSMLYAAWVIYYAICKRKYSFYHKDMWNVTLVALLSIVAILTPVIFFITDIANPSIAGWGDYFRWVGAAAASVIVWEWVERIEALEREEKKDGILGREVFDGDEMLDATDSEEVVWPRPRNFWSGHNWKRGGGGSGSGSGFSSGIEKGTRRSTAHRGGLQRGAQVLSNATSKIKFSPSTAHIGRDPRTLANANGSMPTPPPAAISPPSRSDTTSAASTVYTIRYHNLTTPTPPAPRQSQNPPPSNSNTNGRNNGILNEKLIIEEEDEDDRSIDARRVDSRSIFHLNNPFKRKRPLPPEEVRAGQVIDPVNIGSDSQPTHDYSAWDIKGRIGAFAAEQGEKWREKNRGEEKEKDLPVTIIPAQPRGRTWSPDAQLNIASSSTAGATVFPPHSAGQATFSSEEATAVDNSPSTRSARQGASQTPFPPVPTPTPSRRATGVDDPLPPLPPSTSVTPAPAPATSPPTEPRN